MLPLHGQSPLISAAQELVFDAASVKPSTSLSRIRIAPCQRPHGAQFATAGPDAGRRSSRHDRTGLGDMLYDWAIAWTPESPGQASAATDLPSSVFSAVREQLGLKLEPSIWKPRL